MARWPRSLCFALLALCAPSAGSALDIQLIDTTGMTAAQAAAFEEAAQLWEARLHDPITVVVNVGFADLGTGVLGSTGIAVSMHPYTNALRGAMIADTISALELNAFSAFPVIPSPQPIRTQDQNGFHVVTDIWIATANAKALGIGPGNPLTPQANGADGTVQFANAYASTFDYDRSDGISLGQVDFVAVAAHEIGHALGFMNAIDAFDNLNTLMPTPLMPLDLWRFADTNAAHAIGVPVPETRLLTAGAAEYYDSVQNNVDLSHGIFDAAADPACDAPEGFCQAPHWSDDVGSLMDPSLAPGVQQDPTFLDAHAFDYIGYDHLPKIVIDPNDMKSFVKWLALDLPVPPPPFPGYPDPPDLGSITPPFEPDGAAVLALEWPGSVRSATGFYRFATERAYDGPEFPGLTEEDVPEGQVILLPDQPPPETLPDSFMDFYLVSDAEGVPFHAVGMFSALGTGFEPGIGTHGGYRFDLLFFGQGDGVADDVDAFATWLLEADASGQPDPSAQNVFQIGTSAPNQMVIEDWGALPEPEGFGVWVAGAALLAGLRRWRCR